MFPTIRHVASSYTNQEYSVDFFGEELDVTVTPSASVASSWIDEVLFYNRFNFSHPLLVGVGVQWSPAVSSHSNLPPNMYPPPHNFNHPPHNYSAYPQRNSYYADPSPGDYYPDPPPGSYYPDPSPPGSYYPDPSPPGSYYPDTPPGSYYPDPPPLGSYYPDPPPPGSYYDDDPPPDTLQLCVGNRCLIFQLSNCDHVPEDLRSFLRDPGTIFVGIWNSQDAGKLARSTHRLEIGKLLDIRHFVNDSEGRSLRSCSFEEIVQECMGYDEVRLDQAISRSDWSLYDLGRDQILQASLDVYVCHQLALWVRLWELS